MFLDFYLQADEAVKFEDGCFDRIKAAMPSGDAPMSDGSKPRAPNADVNPDQQNAEQDWGLPVIFDVSIIIYHSIHQTNKSINLFSLPCRLPPEQAAFEALPRLSPSFEHEVENSS